MSASQDLADALRGHMTDLDRYAADLRGRMFDVLKETEVGVCRQISDADPGAADKDSEKQRRLRALIAAIVALITKRYADIQMTVLAEMRKVGEASASAAAKILDAAAGTAVATPILRSQARAAADNALLEGSTVKQWIERMAGDLAFRIRNELTQGAIAGENVDQLQRRVRGDPLGKTVRYRTSKGGIATAPAYQGGVFTPAANAAAALAVTATHSAAAAARQDTWEEHTDLFAGWVRQVKLDTRTCTSCWSKSGLQWTKDGEPIKHKIAFLQGPEHFRCRCFTVPVFAAHKNLPPDIRDEVSADAFDGQPPDDVSFEDWLNAQPDDTQREVLGKGRYDLWKTGKVALRGLIDANGKPLTLEQLQQRSAKGSGSA